MLIMEKQIQLRKLLQVIRLANFQQLLKMDIILMDGLQQKLMEQK